MPFDYAYVSITLRNAIELEPELLNDMQMKTPEQTNKFIEIFRARWDLYEIGGETIELFKSFIDERFKLKLGYYQQLIDEYEKEFNYLDGRKTTTTYHESANSDGTDYDLPRKPDAVAVATTKTNVNGNISWGRTLTGDEDVLELKTRYLKYIRNLYEEFVNEFKDCFAMIYG